MKSLNPEKALSFISLALPWTLAGSLLFAFISISLTQIFLAAALISWAYLLIKGNKTFSVPGFFWPLLVYAALSLLASFFSVNPEISLKDSRELLLFLIVPITAAALTENKAARKTTLAILVSGLASCLYSIFIFLFEAQAGERVAGFMGHYMTQAGLLVMLSALTLGMLFFGRNGLKWLWALGTVLAGFCLILTMTRSAWIGFGVVATIMLLLYKPKTLAVIPVAAALVFLLSPSPIKRRALSIFSLKGYSNQQRVQYFHAGLKIIAEHPWLGTGPDTVDMVFQNPKYGLPEQARRNVHLHNNFTQIAAERGIPTLAAWLAFLTWTFISLVRMLGQFRIREPSLYPHAAGGLAALVSLVISGLFEYNFADSEITMLFLYMITAPFAMKRMVLLHGESSKKTVTAGCSRML